MSLSDPSAPQMTDLRDDTEMEIFDVDGLNGKQIMEDLDPQPQPIVKGNSEDQEGFSTTKGHSDEHIGVPSPDAVEGDMPLFYVDTDPSPIILSATSYESVTVAPLGTSAPGLSEEETIVFKPRTYRKPEPISVASHPTEAPAQPIASTSSHPVPQHASAVWIDPRARPRSDKKAAKRDKRNRKKKPHRQRAVFEGSDIEWGNDGPDVNIVAVHGMTNVDDNDGDGRDGDDVEVLRDYLEGTLLNARVEQAEREEEGSDGDSEIAKEMEKELKRRFGDGGGDAIMTATEELEGNASSESHGKTKEVEPVDGGDEGDWESSSGSSSSADIRNMKAALDDASESDQDEEDEEDMFAGKDSWDETDWFIRNMEVSKSAPSLLP